MKATSLRLPLDLEADIKQLAQEHERSEHGEMIYALRVYVAQQKSMRIANIIGFWLSEMWASEDFGRVTAQNLYSVVQKFSTHPDKRFVTVEDCALAMRKRAQEGLPADWTAEDQARTDESIRKAQLLVAEIDAIDNGE